MCDFGNYMLSPKSRLILGVIQDDSIQPKKIKIPNALVMRILYF